MKHGIHNDNILSIGFPQAASDHAFACRAEGNERSGAPIYLGHSSSPANAAISHPTSATISP